MKYINERYHQHIVKAGAQSLWGWKINQEYGSASEENRIKFKNQINSVKWIIEGKIAWTKQRP